MNVGLHADFSALTQQIFVGGSLLSVGMIIAALTGKVLGCTIGTQILGYRIYESLAVGVGMLPRAEVALIVAEIGKRHGILTTDIYTTIVVITIITSLVTPFVLKYFVKKADATAGPKVIH